MVLGVFNQTLGLPSVNVISVDVDTDKIILEIECVNGSSTCPDCGEACEQVHEVITKKVRDRSVFGKQCWLHLHHRRFFCENCDRTFMERLSWLHPYERYTKRFAKWVEKWGNELDLTSVSKIVGIGYKVGERLMLATGYALHTAKICNLPTRLGIDEFAYKKGKKDYGVVLASRSDIVQVLPSRKEPELRRFFSSITIEARERVDTFTMDMWNTFINLVEEFFPKAAIVIDRFHVMRQMNKVLDKIRKTVQRQLSENVRKEIKGMRWKLLKNYENLNGEEKKLLKNAFTHSTTLHKAYLRKEEFRQIFEKNTDKNKAAKQLEAWMQKASTIKHRSMTTLLKTLHKRKSYILNYFNHYDNNGFMEGIINKVKLIKRKAYGMTNFTHLAQRIMLAFNTPTP